ncbi:otoraplin [Ambystoma mexicanum]|uniref:otoraplin n=1 Tax=Ambystoma mexicanum TaxID=8296 RepID=UPI0037E8797C
MEERGETKRHKMARVVCSLAIFLCLGIIHGATAGFVMPKLATGKLCADEECVYAISLASAEDDYNAPDCRFINLKKGDLIYVYSKLEKEEESGEFWAGSVYSEQYKDQMGIIGYFPSTAVKEEHVYQEATKKFPTTDMDFFCE